jgi:hypothetical protein
MPAIRTSPSALSTSIKAATSAAIASPAPKHRHPSSPSSAPSASKNASSSTPSASKVSNPNLKQATLSFAPKPKPAASSTSSSQAKSTTKAPAATLGLSVPASEPPPTSSTLTPELMARFKKLWPKLPEENASLLELEMRTMAPDWLEVLKGEMSKPTFLEVRMRLFVSEGREGCEDAFDRSTLLMSFGSFPPPRLFDLLQLKRFLLKEQASQKVYPPGSTLLTIPLLEWEGHD